MFSNKYDFISSYQKLIIKEYGKEYEQADDVERYKALIAMITAEAKDLSHATNERYDREGRRRVYYFSMEFLIGRLLYNYLLNMGELKIVEDGLKELGTDLNSLIEQEHDPGLGNGGLGRLAACFLDSMAKEDIPGYGYGMFYRYGLFKQEIKDGYQVEEPDAWLENGYPWARERSEKSVKVKFGGRVTSRVEGNRTFYGWEPDLEVYAVPHEIPIVGYKGKTVNRLSLWSTKPVKDEFDLNAFNNGDYGTAFAYRSSVEAISQILYPSDATEAGKALRLKQEYLMVSAGIYDIIRLYRKNHGNEEWDKFSDRVAIHINDTHPALCGPELMRIFMDEIGLLWDEAWNIVTKTISYTNHTILPEAMEEWPIDMVRSLLPRNYMIIEEIDRRYRESLPSDLADWQDVLARTAILWDRRVRMANLSVITSYSVNGVSALHSDILKESIMNAYYRKTPEKFTNVTNGVSQRRFLMEANPELSKLITETIGKGWLDDFEKISSLSEFADNAEFLEKLVTIKRENKEKLAAYILKDCGVKVNPDSIFDIQVKRFHAYKRQLLNVLKVMYLYDQLINNPKFDMYPCTFIFSGKAAQSYSLAKSVIKLINSLADIINNDERVKDKIKVVFLKNFNVSLAQLIYPAADISEQISTAGMEASGTGNMKFMMNGAITLGTLDGANVEILERVGQENIQIFGLTEEEIYQYRYSNTYNVWDVYHNNPVLKKIIDQIDNGFFSNSGASFWEIHDSLLRNNDYFFVLKDFDAYITAFEHLLKVYQDRKDWIRKSLLNIANSGYFSSDRSIRDYANNIWKVNK